MMGITKAVASFFGSITTAFVALDRIMSSADKAAQVLELNADHFYNSSKMELDAKAAELKEQLQSRSANKESSDKDDSVDLI